MFRLDDPATGLSIFLGNDGTVAVVTEDGILFEGWPVDRVKALDSLIDKATSAASWIDGRVGA